MSLTTTFISAPPTQVKNMKAFKDVEVRITVHLTKYEAEWICMYLHDYSNQADEHAEVTAMREKFLHTLREALDLPENN